MAIAALHDSALLTHQPAVEPEVEADARPREPFSLPSSASLLVLAAGDTFRGCCPLSRLRRGTGSENSDDSDGDERGENRLHSSYLLTEERVSLVVTRS